VEAAAGMTAVDAAVAEAATAADRAVVATSTKLAIVRSYENTKHPAQAGCFGIKKYLKKNTRHFQP